MVELVLTSPEEELFDCLIGSVHFHAAAFSNCEHGHTVIRIAGGWVRDKLLGLESSDVDIALNNQSGLAFAESVNAYLKSLGQCTRTIGVIQANPDQSKHLQTANIKVLGYDIDCVNLRAETYADESRIPFTEIGSPFEDALRRDFTINSLFYNLNTGQIEDFTTRGIIDLERGLIRTPISAFTTFRDDPLRIFRAIRFASRFFFEVDGELQDAARSTEIHSAVLSKVSRERVYKECDGCFGQSSSGMPARPYMAVFLMWHMNILDAVLPLQQIIHSFPIDSSIQRCVSSDGDFRLLMCSGLQGPNPEWPQIALSGVFWLDLLWAVRAHLLPNRWTASGVQQFFADNHFTVSAELLRSPRRGEHLKPLVWAAMCAGMAGLHVIEKHKSVPLVPVALREALKMETLSVKQVQLALESTPVFGRFLDSLLGYNMVAMDADYYYMAWTDDDVEAMGLQLRACRDMWRDCMLFSCALKLSAMDRTSAAPRLSAHVSKDLIFTDINLLLKGFVTHAVLAGRRNLTSLCRHATTVFNSPDIARTILACVQLQQEAEGLQLDGVWAVKPLFDVRDNCLSTRLPVLTD